MTAALPPVRAAVFDLDGTLLDTLADLAAGMNRALASLGLPGHPEDAYRFFVGDGMDELVRRVLPPDSDAELAERCRAAMLREYGACWAERTAPYPGVTGMLDLFAARDVPRAVFSNKPHHFTVEMTRHFFPDAGFAIVRGADDAVPRKPDPAGALAIAAELGASPENVFYLGDTATDMRCARNAGMIAVGAAWGFRGADELRAAGAVHVIDHPLEARRFLDP